MAHRCLLPELEASRVECVVSAVTGAALGVVRVGERFGVDLFRRLEAAGLDGFGENGEFHTCVHIQATDTA